MANYKIEKDVLCKVWYKEYYTVTDVDSLEEAKKAVEEFEVFPDNTEVLWDTEDSIEGKIVSCEEIY